MCGVRTTFSIASSSSLTAGSCSKTSSAAPAIDPSRSASHECSLVDDLSSCRIHEHRRRLHRCERVGVDEMTRLGSEWAVEAHDIRSLERGAKIVTSTGEAHVGSVRLGELGDAPPDPARADDEHLLALETLADHEVRPPLPVVATTERAIALGDPPQESEHQPDRVLGRRIGQDAGRVGDDDPARACRLEVDVVDPDGVVGHDAELRACGVEVRRIDRHRGRHDDSVGPIGRPDQLEERGELPLDLDRHACRLVNARPRHDLVVEQARVVRRRVDVLAQDQSVLEREDVDPVPLEALSGAIRRGRRPLADDEPVARVEPAARELEVGVPLEDPGDVRADGVALDAITRRVVLEDHVRSVNERIVSTS